MMLRVLQPLAKLVDCSAEELAAQLVSIRHYPLRLIREGVPWATAWRRTMQVFRPVLSPDLHKVPWPG